jgi:methylmalonyl-CoA/ethylmalonyl-CoA epimerase
MSDKPIISSIGQIAIAVSDLKQSLEFYRDKLGLAVLFEALPNMAFVSCGQIRLMLTTLQGEPDDHHTSVIYYKVADLTAAVEQIEFAGVEFIQQPQLTAKMPDHELWLGFIGDPDGNLIGIMAELPLSD